VDERVASGPFLGAATNFQLRTQRSHDAEGGVRIHAGPLDYQTSYYRMNLVDELHFNPINNNDINLDPTRRWGWENTLTWRITEWLRLKATSGYTGAMFRSGPFAGRDESEVARWTQTTGISWDIYQKSLTLDAVMRWNSRRYLDADEANIGRMYVPDAA